MLLPQASLPIGILPLLGLLAAAPRAADFKVVTFRDAEGPLELNLYFDSLSPGGKLLEYSGDYQARQKAFRIFAQERYYVEAGEYKGWAEEHYLEKKTTDHQPGFPHLEEYSFEATLYDDKGDTLFLATGALTPWWETGREIHRTYRMQDGSRQEGGIPITSMDDLERDFPALPKTVSLGMPGETQRRVLTSAGALDLAPPSFATRLEVFNLSGKKVHSGQVRPGTTARLPSNLRDEVVVYIKFLK